MISIIFIFLLCLVNTKAITGEWEACSSIPGTCINTDTYTCSSSTRSGLCPGPSEIRCCPAPAGVTSSRCTALNSAALCKRTETCTGTTTSRRCPGPSSITCCSPGATTTPTPTGDTFLPPAPDFSGSTGSCTTPQNNFSGMCIPASICTGGTFTGLCGPGRSYCCVAETRPVAAVPANAEISLAQFKKLFPALSAMRASSLYPYFIQSLTDGNISGCNSIAAYVAQIGHETFGLLLFEEIATGDQYEGPNNTVGNTQPGDGRRYKGRGPLHLTGRDNYQRGGRALMRNFRDVPEEVGMLSGGFAAAAWYWRTRVNSANAASGTLTGFDGTTINVNGCRRITRCNGVEDRRNKWRAARASLQC